MWTEEQRLAYYRKYRQTHRRKLKAQAKTWRKAHPEQKRAQVRRWQAKNPDKVREYKNRSYRKNPKVFLDRVRRSLMRRRERNRHLVDTFKQNAGCRECGLMDFRALVLHHAKGKKEGSLADLVNRGCRVRKLLTEMKKCTVLCANHHAILHYDRRTATSRGAPS